MTPLDGETLEAGASSPSRGRHRLFPSVSEKSARERRVRDLLGRLLDEIPVSDAKGVVPGLERRPSSPEDWRRRLAKNSGFSKSVGRPTRLDMPASIIHRRAASRPISSPGSFRRRKAVTGTGGVFCDLYRRPAGADPLKARDPPAHGGVGGLLRSRDGPSDGRFSSATRTPSPRRRKSLVGLAGRSAAAAPACSAVGRTGLGHPLFRRGAGRPPLAGRPAAGPGPAGFRRATIGVESGDDGVRTWLQEAGRRPRRPSAVVKLKAAGLSVGAVFPSWGPAGVKARAPIRTAR